MATQVARVVIDTKVLDKLTAEMKPKAAKIVKTYGNMMTSTAITLAPVDTGNLINTISSNSQMVDELTYRIQDGTEYGIFQELGHVTRQAEGSYNVRNFVPARPFITPAVEQWRNKFLKAFSELFK